MTIALCVFPDDVYADRVAELLTDSLRDASSCVLTGGTTAGRVYRAVARRSPSWQELAVWFSDERSVDPEHEASNYGMARRILWRHALPPQIHRMLGEKQPDAAARAYDSEMRAAVAAGFDVAVLSLGVDGHICALFPGSVALEDSDSWCVAVDRPDGMSGLTFTPNALRRVRHILLMATGNGKAPATRRLLRGLDSPMELPAACLLDHPHVTLLLDASAAAGLGLPRARSRP